MGTLVKLGLALCIGVMLLAGVRQAWMSWVEQRVEQQSHRQALPQAPAVVPTMNAAEAEKLRSSLVQKLPPIDAASGQRAAVVGLTQRIDIQNRNALSQVPLPGGSFGH